jgi:hypothetical protein
VSEYDIKKYPPEAYDRVRTAFDRPVLVAPGTLREALLWKYGHLNKSGAIPPAHERLISEIQRGWPSAVAALPGAPKEDFLALDRTFGGKTRFITIAFLLHLLRPHEVPIIDQHNFRAVNALMSRVRQGWRWRRAPSHYDDLEFVAAFMKTVLESWTRHATASAPGMRELDKFLMMYGKHIKRSPGRTSSRLALEER